jgi:hypothetical protein
MRIPHIPRDNPCHLDLHQLAFPNTRTPFPGFSPILLIADKLRPERKRRALKRLGLMHRAPALFEKLALRMSRHTQPPHILCPVNIALFESRHRHFQERRQPRDIVLSEVHESLLLTAFRATRLAFEAQRYPPAFNPPVVDKEAACVIPVAF